MSACKRQRREQTHDWQEIKPQTLWPEQEIYERLRPNLFVQLLLRPQRPLLNCRPLLGALSARSFRARHLPLPFRYNDACFKRTLPPKSLQGIKAVLASLDGPMACNH